jgi:hypothetical protein
VKFLCVKIAAVSLHYFRGGALVSFRHKFDLQITRGRLAAGLLAAGLLAAAQAWAQYPGRITNDQNDAKKAPELRAIAVLEWTGEVGSPKACRIVPVTVFDEGQLQDGGEYLARPEPMALAGETEYELEKNGKTVGLFDIQNAGQEQGSWVGYGKWKPLPGPPRPKPVVAPVDDEDDDKPVLHRKKHADGTGAGNGSGSSSGNGSSSASNAPPPDSDRPVLHKQDESANGSDSDRPKMTKKQQTEDEARVESLPDISDPDRPRLKRGRPEGAGAVVVPSLMGLPSDMEQEVAVSDAKNRPDHLWSYTWANPADQDKLKAQLEDLARNALGLNQPAPAATAKKVSTTHKSLKPAPAAAPAPLVDEQFRVFELAYGSGATLVLTAHTDGARDKMKFVTLIAQPDLYGNLLVLLKNVTDGAHLDEKPRMRLVDAVDALADNRGELLFELRGDTQRQFALYRVLRGRAEQLFVSGGGAFGASPSE